MYSVRLVAGRANDFWGSSSPASADRHADERVSLTRIVENLLYLPELRKSWLIDNGRGGIDAVQLRRGVPAIKKDVIGTSTSYEDVFLHACNNGHPLMTTSGDYANLRRFDHTISHGTVIAPDRYAHDPHVYCQLLIAALNHFAKMLAAEMTNKKGLIVFYDAGGEVTVFMPSPFRPSSKVFIAQQRYATLVRPR